MDNLHRQDSISRGSRKGRRLVDAPRLVGPHEEPAGYWELFTDLLLVAAASSMAEVLEEEANSKGFAQFALLYLITINGWLFYTHHYTARFNDESLAHSCILFFFLLGMAASIVNADFESFRGFSWSVALQRVAFVAMLFPVAWCIESARWFVYCLAAWIGVSIILFTIAALGPEEIFVYIWIVAGVWELFYEPFGAVYLRGNRFVPVNIEHTKERLGVLVLVMLGESVITSTITYKKYAEEGNNASDRDYYIILSTAFLLIFMFTLLFFNMQPAPKDHGLRRSHVTGVSILLLNKILGLALLTIGACVKLAVKAVVEQEELAPFVADALRCSVGMSLLTMFGMRLCHYGGRIPRPEDPPKIAAMMYTWWACFAVACVVPFVVSSTTEPQLALGYASALLLVLCLVESVFTHVLEAYLPNEESAPLYQAAARPEYQAVSTVASE